MLQLSANLILCGFMVTASVFDIKQRRIPNKLVVTGLIAAFLLTAAQSLLARDLSPALQAVFGLLAGGLPLAAVVLLTKDGMGMGDMKLMAMAGAFLGWQRALAALAIGVLAGGAFALILILLKKKTLRAEIPFGPFLAVGVIVAAFFGGWIIGILAAMYSLPRY
ncbi:MAG: A24 family peptidase [Defluviitaleaceae bacterium]|nr:A24 family peptidase [Defluviitaleaceae bacterium]